MIENLIYKALIADSKITDMLSVYSKEPAIFYQQCPNDMDEKWDNHLVFPRIIYSIDWQANSERKTAGYMTLDIECLNNSRYFPEDIGQMVLNCISDLFMTDDSGTYAVVWSRTDGFENDGIYGGKNSNEPKVIGVTMIFDILAFPVQETFSPDPVLGLNNFIKKHIPDSVVIGHDSLDEFWKPTNEKIALYCRLTGEETAGRQQFSHTNICPTISIHLFATHPTIKQIYLRFLNRLLSLSQEVILDDNSPMFIKEVSYDMSIEPLYDGQMKVLAEYGVLYLDPDIFAPPLNHGVFKTYANLKIGFKNKEE